MPVAGPSALHRGRLPLRTALLAGLLLPVVGVAALGGVVVAERWSERQHARASVPWPLGSTRPSRRRPSRWNDGDPVPLRGSVGIALSGAGIDTIDALIHAADVALYQAKREGLGPVCWCAEPAAQA